MCYIIYKFIQFTEYSIILFDYISNLVVIIFEFKYDYILCLSENKTMFHVKHYFQ